MTPQKRKESANAILYDQGLLARLAQIGKPHIVGSYRMDMMAWNDLDIDVENSSMSKAKLYELTDWILRTFEPDWYEAKEEVNDEGKKVWFHGFHAKAGDQLFNIDLWFFDEETIRKAEAYCNRVEAMCEEQPGSREAIMRMKQELIAQDLYGCGRYTSMDVYRAVLVQEIQNMEDFLACYVRQDSSL